MGKNIWLSIARVRTRGGANVRSDGTRTVADLGIFVSLDKPDRHTLLEKLLFVGWAKTTIVPVDKKPELKTIFNPEL